MAKLQLTQSLTIDDPKAPERLRGKKITVTLNRVTRKLTFEVSDVPDDMTANEHGYIDWSVGELVDSLRKQFPGVIGDMVDRKILKDDNG